MADATDNAAGGPAPPPAEQQTSITGAVIIATKLQSMLEEVSKTITDRTGQARVELDRIDQTMLEDAERIKAELSGYVAAAEALARQVDGLQKVTDNIRSNRAKRTPA